MARLSVGRLKFACEAYIFRRGLVDDIVTSNVTVRRFWRCPGYFQTCHGYVGEVQLAHDYGRRCGSHRRRHRGSCTNWRDGVHLERVSRIGLQASDLRGWRRHGSRV